MADCSIQTVNTVALAVTLYLQRANTRHRVVKSRRSCVLGKEVHVISNKVL
jgi:putative effector of murein hydrolase